MKKNVFLVLVGILIVAVDVFLSRETQAAIYTGAIAVLSWFFACRYARFSPWRRNIGGRALMYFSISLGAVGAQLLTVWLFGSYPFRPEARAIVFGSLILVLVHINWILRQAQRERRRRIEEAERAEKGS